MKQTDKYWLDRLGSWNRKVAHQAVLVLGGLTPADWHMLPDLVEALGSDDQERRFWAVIGIGRLGRVGAAAVGPLLALLSDPESGIRQSVVRALPRVVSSKAEAGEVVRVLVRMLRTDSNASVRFDAADSIAGMGEAGGAALEPLLEAMERDVDGDVRWWSAIALSELGPAVVAPVAGRIREMARTHRDELVQDALGALVGKFDEKSAGG